VATDEGEPVTRDAFLRHLRRYAAKQGLPFDVMHGRGKGTHYRVRLGDRVSTVQSGELSPFHVERICKQLGIDMRSF
jgi:hypothetical protein